MAGLISDWLEQDKRPPEKAALPSPSRNPRPPMRKYKVVTFSSYDVVHALGVEFLSDWVVFHIDWDDYTKVIAYPSHVVRGTITEVTP